jgi:PAB-dependent poly(A)-specific ribonuclease subunit 3
LAEHHFGSGARHLGRSAGTHVLEQVLWNYVVQIASAVKTIHGSGLAARVVDPTKVLVTGKITSVSTPAPLWMSSSTIQRTLSELQRGDLLQFGQLVLAIGTMNPNVIHNVPKAMEHFARAYHN